MAYPGVLVEIDEVTDTRWVSRGGKHYPFPHAQKETLFERESNDDAGKFYYDDPCEYATFKARQQYEEQQQ